MLFMSADHVAAMNQAVERSAEVRAAASMLPRQMSLTYELHDGPQGQTIYWTFQSGPVGTGFSLLKAEETTDVKIRADWSEMIRAARASRRGEREVVAMDVEGDPADLRAIEAVLQVVRRVATLNCEFPALT